MLSIGGEGAQDTELVDQDVLGHYVTVLFSTFSGNIKSFSIQVR